MATALQQEPDRVTEAVGMGPAATEEATEVQGRLEDMGQLRPLAMALQGLAAGMEAKGEGGVRGQAALGTGALPAAGMALQEAREGGMEAVEATAEQGGPVPEEPPLRRAVEAPEGMGAAKGMGMGLAMGMEQQGLGLMGLLADRPATEAAVLVLALLVGLGVILLGREAQGPRAQDTPGTRMLMAAAREGKRPLPKRVL